MPVSKYERDGEPLGVSDLGEAVFGVPKFDSSSKLSCITWLDGKLSYGFGGVCIDVDPLGCVSNKIVHKQEMNFETICLIMFKAKL